MRWCAVRRCARRRCARRWCAVRGCARRWGVGGEGRKHRSTSQAETCIFGLHVHGTTDTCNTVACRALHHMPILGAHQPVTNKATGSTSRCTERWGGHCHLPNASWDSIDDDSPKVGDPGASMAFSSTRARRASRLPVDKARRLAHPDFRACSQPRFT